MQRTSRPTAPTASPFRWRRGVVVLALLFVAAVSGMLVRESLQVEWSAESVRAVVAQAGLWGPIIFLAMMTFRFAVLIPSPILLSAAGICFGVTAGTVYGGAGLLLSAVLKFAIARLLGREALIARLPRGVRDRLALANSRIGLGALGAASGYPVGPAGLIHVGAILSGISFVPFALAVGIGSVVRAATFSYFGNAITGGEGLTLATTLLVGLTLVPLCVPSWRAWLVAGVGSIRR
jgi:uncharacterized membrane protein YdjX (TVP38/TMEM64 family)